MESIKNCVKLHLNWTSFPTVRSDEKGICNCKKVKVVCYCKKVKVVCNCEKVKVVCNCKKVKRI